MKLIDLGSSYTHDSPARAAVREHCQRPTRACRAQCSVVSPIPSGGVRMQTTTPEYLPPEMVALTTTAVSKEAVCMALRDSSLPYATDMWSVGAVLLGKHHAVVQSGLCSMALADLLSSVSCRAGTAS